MFRSLFYFSYLSILCAFSFVSHPVFYCVLLVVGALAVSAQTAYIIGFSWYRVLLCLIYIGGVYILFIFVSAHTPNTNRLPRIGVFGVTGIFFISVIGLYGVSWGCGRCSEAREYLCIESEGPAYLILGGTLLFGFLILRSITSIKDCYYR